MEWLQGLYIAGGSDSQHNHFENLVDYIVKLKIPMT